MTLPSRLREGNGRTGSLLELESTLNNTGSRRIFELKASVGKGVAALSTQRHSGGNERSTVAPRLQLDYSPSYARSTRPGREPHLFSQVEVRRAGDGMNVPAERKDHADMDTLVEM